MPVKAQTPKPMTKFKQYFDGKYRDADARTRPQGKKYKVQHLSAPFIYSVDEIIKDNETRKCDQFVLCDWDNTRTGIYLVEVKGKNPRAPDFIPQLKGGASWMEGELKNFHNQLNKPNKTLDIGGCFCFLPVLVADALPRGVREKMRGEKVSIKGRGVSIRHTKTGDELPVISEKNSVLQ